MIDQVTYAPVTHGVFKGALVYHVELNEAPAEVEKIAGTIETIKAHKKGNFRSVLIEDLTKDIDDSGMFTLLKTVKDFNWHVGITTTGASYKQWYKWADWMTCLLDDDLWAGFYVNEVIWKFKKGSPEPMLPDMKKGTTLYVKSQRDLYEEVYEFIKKAKFNWLIEPAEALEVYNYTGEVLL